MTTIPPPPCFGLHNMFDSRATADHQAAALVCTTCPVAMFTECQQLAETLMPETRGTWAGKLYDKPTDGCGTERGYRDHTRAETPYCDACLTAHEDYKERQVKTLRARRARQKRAQQRATDAQQARRAKKNAEAADHKSLAELIIGHTEAHFGLDDGEILSPSRYRRAVRPRQIVDYLLRQSGLSLPKAGKAMGRDHTTIIHSIKKVESEPELIAAAQLIQAAIDAELSAA